MVAAESEAGAVSPNIRNDVRAQESIVKRLGFVQLESEKMTAIHSSGKRRNQPGLAQRPYIGARDLCAEQVLQRKDVIVNCSNSQADLFHPLKDGSKAIEPGRIERRAHEPRAVHAVSDRAIAIAAERAECGKPAGVARPHRNPWRAMQKA